jgi:hypothetical protein
VPVDGLTSNINQGDVFNGSLPIDLRFFRYTNSFTPMVMTSAMTVKMMEIDNW